jgi:hypothetical protein
LDGTELLDLAETMCRALEEETQNLGKKALSPKSKDKKQNKDRKKDQMKFFAAVILPKILNMEKACVRGKLNGSYESLRPGYVQKYGNFLPYVANQFITSAMCGTQANTTALQMIQNLDTNIRISDGVVGINACRKLHRNPNDWSTDMKSNFVKAPYDHVQMTGRVGRQTPDGAQVVEEENAILEIEDWLAQRLV